MGHKIDSLHQGARIRCHSTEFRGEGIGISEGSITMRAFGVDGLETEPGIALELSMSREWWVGDKWGVAFAMVGDYHSVGLPGSDANLEGTPSADRFSATGN